MSINTWSYLTNRARGFCPVHERCIWIILYIYSLISCCTLVVLWSLWRRILVFCKDIKRFPQQNIFAVALPSWLHHLFLYPIPSHICTMQIKAYVLNKRMRLSTVEFYEFNRHEQNNYFYDTVTSFAQVLWCYGNNYTESYNPKILRY